MNIWTRFGCYDPKTVSLKDLETALRDLQRRDMSCGSRTKEMDNADTLNDIALIVENGNFTVQEKVAFYELIQTRFRQNYFGTYPLNVGLYNILLMIKENIQNLPIKAKIADVKGLIKKGYAYTSVKTFTVSGDGVLPFQTSIRVLCLTEYGKANLEMLKQTAEYHIDISISRLQKLGLI